MDAGFLGRSMRAVFDHWRSWPIWLRVLSVVGLLACGFLVLFGVSWLRRWLERFDTFSAVTQGITLSVILVVALGVLGFSIYQGMQKSELKTDNERLKKELTLATERWDRLQLVETQTGLWWKPCQIAVPPFVPAVQRRTRFVCVLNLKGGVGKTTVTANLAAGLGLSTGLRVLLVDIDFQGTLGEVVADPAFRKDRQGRDEFVQQLLRMPSPDDALFRRLPVPVLGVPTGRVVMANDRLDTDDFQQQARFFVDPLADPRFRFLTHFHRAPVLEEYDVVLFDCPPRVTTSVVNALFCADHVLIPTHLDLGSIDAVPRMLGWLKEFGPLCQAGSVGVLATQVGLHRGKMVTADKQNYLRLRDETQIAYKGAIVWDSFVPDSATAVGTSRLRIASLKPAGRKLFEKVVEEFRRRVLS